LDTLYHTVALGTPGAMLVIADERYYRKAVGRGSILRWNASRAGWGRERRLSWYAIDASSSRCGRPLAANFGHSCRDERTHGMAGLKAQQT
jgi:hypothetical protein